MEYNITEEEKQQIKFQKSILIHSNDLISQFDFFSSFFDFHISQLKEKFKISESNNHKEVQTRNQFNIGNIKRLVEIVSNFLQSVNSINDVSFWSTIGSEDTVLFECEELDLNLLQNAFKNFLELIIKSRNSEEEIKSLINKYSVIKKLNQVI